MIEVRAAVMDAGRTVVVGRVDCPRIVPTRGIEAKIAFCRDGDLACRYYVASCQGKCQCSCAHEVQSQATPPPPPAPGQPMPQVVMTEEERRKRRPKPGDQLDVTDPQGQTQRVRVTRENPDGTLDVEYQAARTAVHRLRDLYARGRIDATEYASGLFDVIATAPLPFYRRAELADGLDMTNSATGLLAVTSRLLLMLR